MKKIVLFIFSLIATIQLSAQSYCTPTSNPCSGDYIANVTFGGINRNSVCDTPSTGFGYYANYLAMVSPGQSLPITLSPGTPFAQAFIVWIDFNMDYVFSSNEMVFNWPNISYTPVSGVVTIPTTASSGLTRMRVRCADQTATLTNNPCQNIIFGETEDYPVNIDVMPLTVSAGISQRDLMLFPNPANNVLHIHTNTQMNIVGAEAEILNIFGQRISTEKVTSLKTINIEHLREGVYMLVLKGIYQRFIVTHS